MVHEPGQRDKAEGTVFHALGEGSGNDSPPVQKQRQRAKEERAVAHGLGDGPQVAHEPGQRVSGDLVVKAQSHPWPMSQDKGQGGVISGSCFGRRVTD